MSENSVTRSIKENLAAAAPSDQLEQDQLQLLAKVLRGQAEADSPTGARAMQAARGILERVHQRTVGQAGHAQLLLMAEVLRGQAKPDNPASAEALQAARRILERVHQRIARELRHYLPPPVGMALLLNMAAGILQSYPEELLPAAQRLAEHLLARPGDPQRLPPRQAAELCRVVCDQKLAPPKPDPAS